MKRTTKTISLFVLFGLILLFSCNPCGDPVNPGRFEVSNFEPINTKLNSFLNDNDTFVLTLNQFAILLHFEFKQVTHLTPISLFPTAVACSPAEPSFLLPIKEIHFYSFGKNHTYNENQNLDSLFFIDGIASQDFNFKNNQFGGFQNFSCTLMENKNFSDTLQFRIEVKLENGKAIEQANNPIWLSTY